MNTQEVENLIRKYRPIGIDKGSELLLPPEEAISLTNDLRKAGIGILGVNIWYYIGDDVAEELGGLDLSNMYRDTLSREEWVRRSAKEAKRYIENYLPAKIRLVSIVTDD